MRAVECYILILFFVFLGHCAWAGQEIYVPEKQGAMSMTVGTAMINELALKDVDIPQAIEIIARKSGLNIISGENIKGRVTIFLKRVDAHEALRIVLESNGLAYDEEAGIIRVMTAEEFLAKYGHAFGQATVSKLIKLNFLAPLDAQKLLEPMKGVQGKIVVNEQAKTVLVVDSPEKVRAMEAFLLDLDVQITTVTFTLKNVRAQDLVAEVRRMLTQSFGVVEVNAQANALVVTDTMTRVEKVRKAVEAMDARGRVMILEAKLVQVVLNDEHINGVDWDGILEDCQRMRLSGKYSFLVGSDSGRALSYGMVANDDFPTLIEALDAVGLVQEYPLSDIRVAGDEKVRLTVRLDHPSIDMAAMTPAGEDDVQDMPPLAGASLVFTVKPEFDVTGDIVTSVLPQEARPLTSDPFHAGRALHASVLSAHEGYTAVIGGMIISARTSRAHKIPLLGDLPILGVAFRLDGSFRREEFIVFLTPKSISLSQILADESAASDATLTGEE